MMMMITILDGILGNDIKWKEAERCKDTSRSTNVKSKRFSVCMFACKNKKKRKKNQPNNHHHSSETFLIADRQSTMKMIVVIKEQKQHRSTWQQLDASFCHQHQQLSSKKKYGNKNKRKH